MKDNRVKFLTLGCKVNQYETEAVSELFENEGFAIVDKNEVADVYVINTCTVTSLSDSKSRQFIRKSKKENPNSSVVVMGCYSQVSPEEVEAIEGVDIILGTSERNKIVDLTKEYQQNKKKSIPLSAARSICVSIISMESFLHPQMGSLSGNSSTNRRVRCVGALTAHGSSGLSACLFLPDQPSK